jgi:hypothetical protein
MVEQAVGPQGVECFIGLPEIKPSHFPVVSASFEEPLQRLGLSDGLRIRSAVRHT